MPARTSFHLSRRIIEVVAVAATYYAAARLGLVLAFEKTNASPVWPPSGIAFAAVLLLGFRVWPGIYFGAFLANVMVFLANQSAANPTATAVSLVIAAGNTMEALAGGWLLRWGLEADDTLDKASGAFKFVAVALAMCLVSACVGPTAIAATGIAPWTVYGPVWFTWWLGDTAGVLVITPLVLSWSRWPARSWDGRRLAEFLLALVLVLIASEVVFGDWSYSRQAHYPLPFVLLPLLIWLAVRFGHREASAGLLLLSGIAIWETVHGTGPFARSDVNESLLLLLAFVGVSAVTTIVMAATATERKKTDEALRRAHQELEARVQARTAELVAANEAQRAEMARRRRLEEKFRGLLDSAPDAMVIVDQQGTIVLVNMQTVAMFGYERHELLGQPVEMLMPGRFRERHRDRRDGYFADPRTRPMGVGLELFGVRKDGSEFPVEISLSPLRTDEGVLVSSAIRDITPRVEMEEKLRQSERLAAIGQMAAGLAHDSRNALQQIQLSVDRLHKRLGEGGDADTLAAIQQAHDRLARLLEDVRGYAAPVKLDRRRLNVAEIWREAWHQLGPFRKGREAKLQEHTGDVDLTCWADQLCLERVFHNILLNSLAACGDPTLIEIRCSARALNGQPAVCVAIRDNGPGLNHEQKEKIFQPFFTTKTQGTGLGMSIAKRIIEAHGGRIAIGHGSGPGAEILITLPRGPG